MSLTKIFSPNFSKKPRKRSSIKFIIIHYTGMQSKIESLKRLTDPKSKVSAHYLIDRKGEVIKLVKESNIAWHAGKSKWKKINNLNRYSIGIELVNKGHKFGYQRYTNSQIKSLIILCKRLKKKYKIKSHNILGHSDIAPLRKVDPGEKFPWKKLSTFNLGVWYKVSTKKNNLLSNKKKKYFFYKNLFKIGYRYFKIKRRNANDKFIIKAFQQKYRPERITGNLDKKTLQISHFLAN